MDLQRFVQELPALYEGWGLPSVQPRSSRFAQVLAQVRGLTSPCVLQLLNHAVGCLEGDEVYAEVGCFQGATLIGALRNQPSCIAHAADNFSQFDPGGQNQATLMTNLEAFTLRDQVRFHNEDAEDFLTALRSVGLKVGVYFYDGAHDYRSQLMDLLLAVPVLAEHALLVVDDSNWSAVKQAVWDFLAVCPQARLLLDLPTPANSSPTFWNGLMVLSWNASGHNGYDRATLRNARQPALLESLYALQGVNLKVVGNTIRMVPPAPGTGPEGYVAVR